MGKTEATARFYFTLTYQLAGENILNIPMVEQQNIYLCLSVASLIKDRVEEQKRAHKKMEHEMKSKIR